MWLVWVGLVVLVLKGFGVLGFDSVSWWWISLPFVAAAIWFEVFERRLGFDRKKAFDELDRAKQRRIKEALARDDARRRRPR